MVHAPPSKGWKGFVKNVIAGGAAGTIEVLCMYPLDVVKTRMQLSSGPASAGVPKTVFGTLRHIAATEGVGNLYRGIISPILAEAPKRACKFASNEQYKKLFAKANGDTNGFRLYLAGASAGATEAFVNTPFEVVKVRMQAKENLARYKGTSHALTTIVKEEGLLALYKGFETQLVRNALWNGAYFSLIQKFKDFAGPRDNPTEQSIVGFLCGAAAGIVGTTCNTPFDVVKSRMQNQITLPGQQPKYRYSFQGVAVVFREEGLRACYKGYMPRIYRLGPGGGIMLVAFDFINSLLTF